MNHNLYMQEAYKEALKARDNKEVPIGAVLVYNDKIISRNYNKTITNNDPTAHAEILVLREGAKVLGNHRLCDTFLYVTLEPCPMCVGAMVQARIDSLIYGSKDYKIGSCGTAFNIINNKNFNHKINITSGIMEKESKELLQTFFRSRR